MTSYNTIEAIDKQIEQAKATVEFGIALERLRSNRDWKKIVAEGYFEREAIRLVHLKADVNMQSAQSQEAINKQIDAIGAFSQYLTVVLQMASLAEKSIDISEADREDFLAEELK